MSQYSRTTAKHATVCPRCKGYISVGTTIVLDEDSTKWSHALCPGFDVPRIERTEEQINARWTVIKFNSKGEVETQGE
jgi:hypothetical protein